MSETIIKYRKIHVTLTGTATFEINIQTRLLLYKWNYFTKTPFFYENVNTFSNYI